MPDGVYYGLTNASLECMYFGVPTFSQTSFTRLSLTPTNSFSYLIKTNNTNTSELSFSCPTVTSSPATVTPGKSDLPLGLFVSNCQSIKAADKPVQLQNIINITYPDIVMGLESLRITEIKSTEVVPPSYQCYKNNRVGLHGCGVYFLVSSDHEDEEPEELQIGKDCVLVWARLKVRGSRTSTIDHAIGRLTNMT